MINIQNTTQLHTIYQLVITNSTKLDPTQIQTNNYNNNTNLAIILTKLC